MPSLGLKGSLEEFNIEDVFGLLAWGKTGTLSAKRGEEEIALSLVRGWIAGAEHFGVPQLPFGEILRLTGHLTPQHLEEIPILKIKNQRQAGAILVELGLIGKEVLDEYLRLRIRNAVGRLFTWQDGTFSFRRDMLSPDVNPPLKVRISEAIEEGRQFREGWNRLSHKVRDLDLVVQLSERAVRAGKTDDFSRTAARVAAITDGGSSIRTIAQCLFLNDLEVARAVDELLYAGAVKLGGTVEAKVSRLARDEQTEDDLFQFLAKPESRPVSHRSDKTEDRIKTLLKLLQDSANDLLSYQDSRYANGRAGDLANLLQMYLEQRFSETLTAVQAQFPALEALQVASRRVDASDLIETYDLILGDMRRSFYEETAKGLSLLVKVIFDWVISTEIDNPIHAVEYQEVWQVFLREVDAKVAELTAADGWGNKSGVSSRLRRGRNTAA